MIQLHTFGDAMIRVGEKEIRPTAPVLFAALLYLCAERGRRVPRAALQELLFPEKDERSGAHSVRQLLYKLRSLGVPLETTASHTTLRAAAVTEEEEVGEELLPGYTPQLSVALDEWVAEYRSQRLAAARSRLLRELAAARAAGDNPAIARLAAALLRIDPLNEPATFARSEAMAVAGQVHRAVQLLKEYGDEVGTALRLPADLLRKRIAERFVERTRTDPPLLGRSRELALLLGHFARASTGRATMSLVWGEAGIGKSRLVQEFRAHVLLKQAVVVTTHCQPHDSSRPMGALVDLVPRLLQSRGALGIAPEAMRVLRGLTGGESLSIAVEPDVVAARIRVALEELILCVCSEAPLVMIVEDAHWQDEASTSFLRSLLSREVQIHIVLTSRTFEVAKNDSSSQAFAIRLEPLAREDAIQLLNEAVGRGATFSDELRDRCIDLAAGHPLFICSIAEHLRVSASAPSTTTTLRDLLRRRLQALSPQAVLLLRCISSYATLCTLERARRSLGMALGESLLAVQDLAERGLITQDGETIRCAHDLLAETVLADMPQATRAAVMEQVAMVLEEEGTTSRQASLLWACAECWVQAGRSARAASAFRRCAQFAMEIGQSRFAIEAMEKAQGYCAEKDLEECIEDTVRLADASIHMDASTRNIDRLYAHRLRMGLSGTGSTLAEFARVNAKRRELLPVWDERDVLERLAFDETAKAGDRIRAARAFYGEGEEYFATGLCSAFHQRLEERLRRQVDDMDWCRIEVVYRATFGRLEQVVDMATQVIRTYAISPGMVGLAALGDSAFALFKAGHLGIAREAHDRLMAEAVRLELSPVICGTYAERGSFMALQGGDPDLAQRLHIEARRLFSLRGEGERPAHLSNEADLAIATNDVTRARRAISTLKSRYPHCFTPNRQRTTLAQELILDHLEGVSTCMETIQQAEELFDLSKTISECDALVVGLVLAKARSGSPLEADALMRDYLTHWRYDRYPLAPFLRDLLANITGGTDTQTLY